MMMMMMMMRKKKKKKLVISGFRHGETDVTLMGYDAS
jgi:hypothetical protein